MPKLTKRLVERTKPPKGDRDVIVWDSELKGLGMRVKSSGVRTYFVNYRNKYGRMRRYSIGRHGTITATQARKQATKILGEIAAGKDPASERTETRGELVFRDLAEEYIKRRCPEKRSGKEDERIIKKDLLKPWGHHPARMIKRRDVIQLIDKINDRGAPIMANRTLAVIKRVYNFGIARDLVEANPTALVKPPGKEQRRERVLSDAEIRTFWHKLDDMEWAGSNIRAALRLILVLGQRSGEILSMEWNEIDINNAIWELPGLKTKNARSHRVPLSPLALHILDEIKPLGTFVFPARMGKRLILDKSMNSNALALAIRRNRKLFDTETFTPHDLRRTCASGLASLGISRTILSKILNHIDQGITGVYDRYAYDNEKRTALDAWSQKLMNIIEGKKGEIIPLINR